MKSDIMSAVADLPTHADEEERTPATPESTREAIVKGTGSGYVPVRHVFVQKRHGTRRGSTLGKLVSQRKRRELILYLLVLTSWDSEARRAPWPAAVWLRALRVEDKPSMTWSRSSLSETWTELVRLKLVRRTRERRHSRITPQREDCAGDYFRPDGKTTAEHYFALPGEFWTGQWFDRLGLAGVATLLIVLKETNKNEEVHLTHAETAHWYGISETTAKRGYQELVDAGLVEVRDEYKRADYSADGLTRVRYYRPTGAFSTEARRLSRAAAAKGRSRRLVAESAKGKAGSSS